VFTGQSQTQQSKSEGTAQFAQQQQQQQHPPKKNEKKKKNELVVETAGVCAAVRACVRASE
jgi:hypothetical protein